MNCFGFLSNYLLKSKILICMLKYNGLNQCGPGDDSTHLVRWETSRWSSQFSFRGNEFWTAEKFNCDFITNQNVIRELSLPTCMPKAEENAKLLIFFFPFGCRFGRVYTITAPFTLELKWLLAFSLMMGELLFIMIGSQYQNLHFSNKKPKTQSNSAAQPKSQTKTCSLETLVFKFLKFLFVWNVLFTLPPHLPAIFTWLIPSHSSDLSLNISFLIICFHTTMRLFFMAFTIIWNHTFIFFQKPYMYFCVYLNNICLPHWM